MLTVRVQHEHYFLDTLLLDPHFTQGGTNRINLWVRNVWELEHGMLIGFKSLICWSSTTNDIWMRIFTAV